ncbi:DUF4190 domain-containing protein [Pontibacillus litoralis]|uniref:Membrane protein n=1 Tax=Pontibacillus litoralis JSM 072002 TaxID=1385512 RepID=A0A0A5G6Y3_9BACI|nr:DUF4190 domain-containing protein [Pontibacillus litoralis]KGX88896.1 membrane protein [Pontibacillus litoralis JSM 072002]
MDNRFNHDEQIEDAPKYGNEKVSQLEGGQNQDDTQLYAGTDDVEFAQEAAIERNIVREPMESSERETSMESDVQTGFGWVALVVSIVSFFVLPVVMGAAGIILGFISKRRGADTLGNVAIFVGIVSIVLSLFFAPFV